MTIVVTQMKALQMAEQVLPQFCQHVLTHPGKQVPLTSADCKQSHESNCQYQGNSPQAVHVPWFNILINCHLGQVRGKQSQPGLAQRKNKGNCHFPPMRAKVRQQPPDDPGIKFCSVFAVGTAVTIQCIAGTHARCDSANGKAHAVVSCRFSWRL